MSKKMFVLSYSTLESLDPTENEPGKIGIKGSLSIAEAKSQ
jgi:hypothetical protein